MAASTATNPRSPIDWVSLNRFSNLPVLAVGFWGTLFVPVIALLIKHSNDVVSIVAAKQFAEAAIKSNWPGLLNVGLLLQKKIHLGPSLILLYLSALLLALGRITYALRCPKKIAQHGSYSRYVAHLAGLALSLSQITEHRAKASKLAVSSLMRSGVARAEAEGQVKSFKTEEGAGPEVFKKVPESVQQAVSEMLGEKAIRKIEDEFTGQLRSLLDRHQGTWQAANMSQPKWRTMIAGCYGLSAIFAAIVFFGFAPLKVCSATNLSGPCERLSHTLGYVLANF